MITWIHDHLHMDKQPRECGYMAMHEDTWPVRVDTFFNNVFRATRGKTAPLPAAS
jgi:hypothetical protein